MTMRTGRLGKFSCADPAPAAMRSTSHAPMITPIRHRFMVCVLPRSLFAALESVRICRQDADNPRGRQERQRGLVGDGAMILLRCEIIMSAQNPASISKCRFVKPSLRANGSRECAPDDRLREAIHSRNKKKKNGLLRCARNDVQT